MRMIPTFVVVVGLTLFGAVPAHAAAWPWSDPCPEGKTLAEDGSCVPEWWYRERTDWEVQI